MTDDPRSGPCYDGDHEHCTRCGCPCHRPGRHVRPDGAPVPQFLRDHAAKVAREAGELAEAATVANTAEIELVANRVLGAAETLRAGAISEVGRRTVLREARHRA